MRMSIQEAAEGFLDIIEEIRTDIGNINARVKKLEESPVSDKRKQQVKDLVGIADRALNRELVIINERDDLRRTLRAVMETIDSWDKESGDGLPHKRWHWYEHARDLVKTGESSEIVEKQ